MTKTFKEVLQIIRTAVLGREVREGIAHGMEHVEAFTKQSESFANASKQHAETAHQYADQAGGYATDAKNSAEKAEKAVQVETDRATKAEAELQSSLSLAIFQAEAATASLSDKTDALLDWMERMTEIEQFSLVTSSGDTLETASGEVLEANFRVVRTAKTLEDAEYLPVSLALLKQCMEGGSLNKTSAILGKSVLGRMKLGTS